MFPKIRVKSATLYNWYTIQLMIGATYHYVPSDLIDAPIYYIKQLYLAAKAANKESKQQ